MSDRPVVTITDAMLAQWRESAEADLASERPWQCHPAAILAALDALETVRGKS